LETVEPNGVFGEMALIDGSPRSATAVAREPTELAVIDERAFLYLVEKHPRFALDLMRGLARRLRRTTENL
jgi:CRP-like cAMP-binding protein